MKNKLNFSVVVRSLFFWFSALLALPVYNVLLLFIFPLPIKLRHRLMISAAYYFNFLLKYVGKIRYRVSGLENIPNHPAILAANHQSNWETVAFNCIFPPSVWIMKREILKIPLFGWGIMAIAPIAINRSKGESALAQVIEQGCQRFKQGFWITVFPEGTRVKPKVRKPFKYGPAKLAISLKAAILPVAHNAGYFWPKSSFWLYPGTVTAIIGKPIYPDSDDPVEYTQKVEKWIVQQLDKMGA